MAKSIKRRHFLGAATTIAVLPAAAGLGRAADPCEEYLERRAELDAERDRLDRVASDLEASQAEHDELLAAVVERYHEVRGPPVYEESNRESATEVASAVRDAVVFLDMEWEGEFGPRTGTATGWFRDDGVVVTNAHNVDDFGDDRDPTLRGWTVDGEAFEFEIVDYVEGRDPDVAALEADVEPPGTVPIGSTSGLSGGDLVVQVGHPGGFGHWVMTLGEVVDAGSELETTVPGLSGVSGSPLVNLDGEAIGLTYAGTAAGDDPWTPGTAPSPADSTVRQYPFQIEENSLHVPVETVQSQLEEWI